MPRGKKSFIQTCIENNVDLNKLADQVRELYINQNLNLTTNKNRFIGCHS